jgi:hypothetical protein
LFLHHGVALIGPGDPGPWRRDRSPEDYRDEKGARGDFVRRFAEEVQVGDLFLLRSGANRVKAVGIVASAYMYLQQFDDVNGWDLQHARRVRWGQLAVPREFESRVFGGSPSRFSRVKAAAVLEFAKRYVGSAPFEWQDAPLPPLPADEPLLDHFDGKVGEVAARARDLEPLFLKRGAFGEVPKEDETVTHFVVPLCAALGWPPEHIAIKWRDIDVALFRKLPRIPENCHLVIEAKRLWAGIEGALPQGRRYVRNLGRPIDVLVTDGIRYRLYDHSREYDPVAYANLVRLKRPAARLFERLRRP